MMSLASVLGCGIWSSLIEGQLYYIQLYQAIKYLSLDIAEFIEQGPHMAELSGV